ncbi:MAG: protein kinase [Burkholderiales bacterium]
MLAKMIFVGPRSSLLEQVRKVVHDVSPSASLDVRDPAKGRPGPDFPWSDYDVVFLAHDLGLPSESGLAWLRGIMSDSAGARVILLASRAHAMVRDTAIDLGAAACLPTDDAGLQALGDLLVMYRDELADEVPDSISSEVKAGAKNANSGRAPNSALTESGSAVRIPGYKIEKLLARGGQSAVYTALQTSNDSRIALKVLSMQGDPDPEFLSRFMREYATLANLNHPHLIQILERGFANDFAYIAMEFCPLGDLKARLRPGGIEPLVALNYLDQVADGLSAAHNIGIVHRDIKPGNVLLRDQNLLVVTDFGVAADNTRNTRITRDQAIIGTPLYVSPEQIEGRTPDARCDLYSLGVVLYQILTGYPPFQSDSRISLLGMHINAPIPKLPEKLSAFQPLIEGLLAKDPDERFQNTDELRQGIEWVRKSLPRAA